MPLRITYLGPTGTFTEDALLAAIGDAEVDAVASPTIYDAIVAVDEGGADRALVPFENSIEGAVRSTLDTLAFDARSVTIVGEHDHPISHSLIARTELPLDGIEVVLSHPQANAQCAHFIRRELQGAEVRALASTAQAVRAVSESDRPWAALGAASAARIYGCVVLRAGVEDSPDNLTRFVWLAPDGTPVSGDRPWRTTLMFSELGEDRPGALVDALTEFSRRAVNLTRIESRPLRQGLGRYMFFVDLDGAEREPVVAEAIDGLRAKAETVRILGSYPVATEGIPGSSA
ncbi:MAG TPA: prephenate dehydratase [Solirubrobacterales bacterium]|jgi:prephenate dehydratase|nr:prephenate dehydratase [Solirubrobacterales bacterium]